MDDEVVQQGVGELRREVIWKVASQVLKGCCFWEGWEVVVLGLIERFSQNPLCGHLKPQLDADQTLVWHSYHLY